MPLHSTSMCRWEKSFLEKKQTSYFLREKEFNYPCQKIPLAYCNYPSIFAANQFNILKKRSWTQWLPEELSSGMQAIRHLTMLILPFRKNPFSDCLVQTAPGRPPLSGLLIKSSTLMGEKSPSSARNSTPTTLA